jgi:ring-1,2-phenylacetyl-CoA epoxidase subunit PaaC
MAFDAAYEALTDHEDDARWAYGTGFADPLAGVATAVPSDVDTADLVAYCLMLGDDALIMSHGLQRWITRLPELEDELAIANIGLDLLGQARLLLDPGDFRNVLLAERADADFAHLTARLLVFATWRLALLDRLAASRDPVLAAIGAKGVKEVTYHREYAAQWVVRLGDGTDVSHERMRAAMDAVWPLTAELFRPHEVETRLAAAGVGVDPAELRAEFDAVLAQVLAAATLNAPATAAGDGAGRAGVHTAALSDVLSEMQELARSVPGGAW